MGISLRSGTSNDGYIQVNSTDVMSFTGSGTRFVEPGYFATTALTYGATTSWDANAAQVASLTLTGNATMAAPTGLVDGGHYSLMVIQDSTGSRTVAWNAVYKFPSGSAPTLTTTASAKDILSFRSDGTNMYLVGISKDVK